MYVQSPNLGKLGLLPDQPESKVPIGGWNVGKNVRFNDEYIERINEPDKILDLFDSNAGKWLQIYEDSNGPRDVYATDTRLYQLNIGGTAWVDVTRLSGAYTGGGNWHSFQWGDAVVFNNGLDWPQILYDGAANFIDLPNWGLLTSGQKAVTARSLRAFKNFMIACDITLDGTRQPNAVWWSSPGVIDNDVSNFESPSWDYEATTELSGLNYVAVESGPIIDSLALGNSQIIYTSVSANALTLIGGNLVFSANPLFNYGISSLGAVAKYNRKHFCVGPTTIYVHDGTLVAPIADGRNEDDFYSRLADLDVRCTEYVSQKEIHTLYNGQTGREYMIYNYKDDNFAYGDATTNGEDVSCIVFDIKQSEGGVTWGDLTQTWAQLTEKWVDFAGTGEKRALFWLTSDSLYEAEANTGSDAGKEYYVQNEFIDLSELSPQITTNDIKELYSIYPHIDGSATTQFTVAASERLNSVGTLGAIQEDFSPSDDEKVDIDVAGRFLNVRIEITSPGPWRLSTMDYEVDIPYGR